MPFNTRNPIPSGDLRDLDDNARNIDTWANDKTKLSHPDRFGVERRTWHGIEQEANLNIQQAIDAKNAAQEAAMISGFSKYADTLAQLEAGIGTDYLEGDVVMVFQDENRGDTSSIFKIESGAAEFKLTFDKTRQDLLSFTGNISADAEWSDVPAHSDHAFDVQAQALANRTEFIAQELTQPSGDEALGGVATYADLRDYTGHATVMRVGVLGTKRGGIWGTYVRDDTDTTSIDNAGLVVVDGAGRRWKRKYEGAINVEWFGADGTLANDDPAFTAANASAPNGGEIFAPCGQWHVNRFWIRPGVKFRGGSKANCIIYIHNSSTEWGIGLTQPYSSARDFTINGQFAAGYGLLIDGPKTVTVDNIRVTGFKGQTDSNFDGWGVVIQSTWSHGIRNIEVTGNRRNIWLRDDGGEINQLIFDNVTQEYSDEEGILIERGVNIKFVNGSWGHHGGEASGWTGKAMIVNHADATIEIDSAWSEWASDAIDFSGKRLIVKMGHFAGAVRTKSGIVEVTDSDFFGYGGKVIAPSGSTAKVVLRRCRSNVLGDAPFEDIQGGCITNIPDESAYPARGTFTPFVIGTTSEGSATYALRSGRYQKVGNVVHFNIAANYSSHTGTGFLRIKGLPFTAVDPTGIWTPCAIRIQDIPFTGPLIQAYVANNEIVIQQVSASGSVTQVPMDEAGIISIAGSYMV